MKICCIDKVVFLFVVFTNSLQVRFKFVSQFTLFLTFFKWHQLKRSIQNVPTNDSAGKTTFLSALSKLIEKDFSFHFQWQTKHKPNLVISLQHHLTDNWLVYTEKNLPHDMRLRDPKVHFCTKRQPATLVKKAYHILS